MLNVFLYFSKKDFSGKQNLTPAIRRKAFPSQHYDHFSIGDDSKLVIEPKRFQLPKFSYVSYKYKLINHTCENTIFTGNIN